MAQKKTTRPYKQDTPLSLSPLDLKTALAGLLPGRARDGEGQRTRLELTPDQVRILYRLGQGEEIHRLAASDPGNPLSLDLDRLRAERLVTWPPYGESGESVPVSLTDRGQAVVEAMERLHAEGR